MTIDWVGPPSGHWPASVGVVCTTRRGRGAVAGHSQGPYAYLNLATHVGDEPHAVTANRQILVASTGVERVQWLDQVHGRRCIEASSQTAALVPEADAAWTSERGLGLAVLTADCVPVVICDRAGSLVAVAHAGWRGLVGGVLTSVVDALTGVADALTGVADALTGVADALPAAPTELLAWIGPAIGPEAYEVGEEVVAAVAALGDGGPLSRACVRPGPKPGKYQLDLFTLSERLLQQAGVPVVHCERLCTHSDPRFYSYRRDSVTGRMATLAWLR
ncbi:MAG: polyphenol oxidase family protein [Pseudomonadales bacterium]